MLFRQDDYSNKAKDVNIVYVFIDASNVWQAQKAKGKMFDFEKTVSYLKNKFEATEIKVFY